MNVSLLELLASPLPLISRAFAKKKVLDGVEVLGDRIAFNYKGMPVTLECYGEGIDVALLNYRQNFLKEFIGSNELWTRSFDVKGKKVIDIGSGIGDTAIKFVLDGAERVFCFDCDKLRNGLAIKNVAENGMQEKIMVEERGLLDLNSLVYPEADAIKCDIDGGEYALFLNASNAALQRYSEILIEYHKGYNDLVEKLRDAGFAVKHTKPILTYGGGRFWLEGVIMARRI